MKDLHPELDENTGSGGKRVEHLHDAKSFMTAGRRSEVTSDYQDSHKYVQ